MWGSIREDLDPGSVAFTPDQSRVLFFADQDVDEQNALCSARLDGSGTPARLSPLLGANEDFFWLWSLVDDYAWYMVRNSSTFRTSIYRAPIDGPSSSTAQYLPGLWKLH